MMDSNSSSSSSSPSVLDYSRLNAVFQFPPNYTLVTILGRGGFGDVLKCIKEDTKEAVAVKVPQMGCCLNNELALLKYFMENNLDKFNIVKLIDSFTLRNNRAALAFEMLDITLRDYIFTVRDFTPMDLHDVRSVVQQMATALNALNTIHMIHSDIKLDNIMLVDHAARPLRIKLIDFGLAFPTCSVTQGEIHQTTHYRAPEIILGLPFTESIDMWSLGIVMGYMVLGDALFPGNTEYDVVRCIVDLLGVPPDHLLSAGKHSKKYFVKQPSGNWKLKTALEYWGAWVPPNDYRAYDFRNLDDVENLPQENLIKAEPDEKKECIDLLKAILEMDPNKRISPDQVLAHPFIRRGSPHQSSDNQTLEVSTSHTDELDPSNPAGSETTQASEAKINQADGCSTTETLGTAFTVPPGFVFERPLRRTYSLSWERDQESCSYKTFTVGSLSPAVSAEPPQADCNLSDDSSGFYGSASATSCPGLILVQPAPPECILSLDEDGGQQSDACPLDSHKNISENSPEGGRKSGLFSPSTASLPAFSSLAPAEDDGDLTLRPSCTLGPDTADSTSTTALARCSATQDIRQRCSGRRSPVGDGVTAEKRKAATVSSPKRETPLSPEWSTLRKKTEDSRADFHGLPPTPQVHMGACFSKVFNGCPLKIHCAVTWILPKTKDQYLILGAEEGIYTLNLNELHEDTLEKLLPQRCTWLYVMNNVLMSVSGKSSQLYSHNLTALFEQKGHLQKKHSSLSLSTNRFTERISPRKFAISVKIPDTKGCRRCSVARNPYTDSTFLCGAVPSGLVLLLWYEPLQKFMHLKHIAIKLPDPLPVFELLVLVTDEFPQLCVGVRDCSNGKQPISQQLKFDIIELNSTPISTPDSGALMAVQVTQLDRDTVLIALEKTVKIVNLRGLPSKELAAEMVFDFPIETLVCLQDSVLAFWKHGLKGKSFHSNEVTQEITDESRVFKVLGTNRDIILQSTPTDDPSALSNLYILTGHESSY